MSSINQSYSEHFYSSTYGNIFYRFRKGNSNQWISFLHGYPTSSLDYAEFISEIPEHYNVIAHDHLGFGMSDKPLSNDYLLIDQANIVCELYKYIGAEKVHVVAHDYGTSVATELLARSNANQLSFEILTLTLCNGSMLIDMSKLRLIQKLLKHKWIGPVIARLTSSNTFHRNMRNIWYDKTLYDREEFDQHWQALVSNNGKSVLPKITRYINQRYEHYDRWIGSLSETKKPIHILWAENDPVAVIEMAYKLDTLIDGATINTIKKCGHYPMIEKQGEWLSHVMTFIEDHNS